jgi:IS5 family transposase
MKLDLPVPDHSTLSRRRRKLEITLPVKNLSKSVHLVIDSTGVKVYGEGEWKVRQHGIGKRRTWRKLHFCSDEATLEIVSVVASTNDVSDAEALPDLLDDAPVEIKQVSADGAYDQRKCYDTLNKHGAKAAIPPRKGAKIWQHANSKADRHARDENLRRIRKVGRKEWKRESNYHRRSLAETQVFRFKTIFGDRLQTRQIDNLETESGSVPFCSAISPVFNPRSMNSNSFRWLLVNFPAISSHNTLSSWLGGYACSSGDKSSRLIAVGWPR